MAKVEMNFPSNSNKRKDDVAKKKVDKVVRGNVVKKRKSPGARFTETFLGEDLDSVKEYIIYDVIVPSIKTTLVDGIEMLLWGRTSSKKNYHNQSGTRVSYGSHFRSSNTNKADTRTHKVVRGFDNITIDNRGEAEEVITSLIDLIVDYGEASIGDLNDLVGITGEFTDDKYGWTDLSSARVERVRDGYMLKLPKPKALV